MTSDDTGLDLKLSVVDSLDTVTTLDAETILDLASRVAELLPSLIVEPHAEVSGDEFDARTTRTVSARRRDGGRRVAIAFRGEGSEWTLDGVSILPRNVHRIGGPQG